jgi:spore coat polysaccharide biosynthesis predicted glycosyltransferase SpsG
MGEPRPIVALRADGGTTIGLGHARRCLALAQACAPWADCRALVGEDEATVALVRGHGVPFARVEPSVDATLAEVRRLGAGALVIDTPLLDPAAVAAALATGGEPAGPVLLVVDDTATFPVPGDLVLNPAAGLTAPAHDRGRYLLGPEFAPLVREFAEAPRRDWRDDVERVLVVLGGAAPAGVMGLLASVARRALPDAGLDVIVGPAADRATVHRALRQLDGVTVHEAPAKMRGLMLDADVAVTAGGVTLLELAATATPIVGVCRADNQRANLAGLERAQAMVFAGATEDRHLGDAVGDALGQLRFDVDRRRALGERARCLVDGRGAERVAAAIRARLADRRSGAGAASR